MVLIFAAVLLVASTQLAAVLLCYLAIRRAKNFAAEIQEAATRQIAALVAGEPCEAASVLNAVARSVGSEAGRSAKAAIMAELSHVQRAANADAIDVASEAVGERSPQLGMVLSGLGPRSRKSLFTNPLVQAGLQMFLGGGLGGNHHNNNGGGSPPADYTGRRHRE